MKYKYVFFLSFLVASISNAQVFEMEKSKNDKSTIKDEIVLEKGQEEVLFVQEENPQEKVVKAETFSIIVQSKKYEKIEQWLSSGASINQQLYEGNTIIHLSAMHQDKRLLDIANKYKANFLQLNNQGESALYWASASNNINYLQSLKEAVGIKLWDQLVSKNTKTQRTPLHSHILYKGDKQVIDFLLAQKIDINQSDNNKQTALHYAAAIGKWDLLIYLISKGGDISRQDKEKKTIEDYILEKADMSSTIKLYPYLSENGKKQIEERAAKNSSVFYEELKKANPNYITIKK